jgi:pimeloyl-ACP methyl ester carboxylesterase
MTALEDSVDTRTVLVEPFDTNVMVRGQGPPLVFLHSQYGLRWNDYLEALSRSFTVYAPEVAPHEVTLERLDDMLDLVSYMSDVLDALDIERAHVVGHSLGAALAAELAAISPARVDRLVLLSPLGIWSDNDPVADLVGEYPATRATRLFVEPEGPAATEWLAGLISKDRVYLKAMRAYAHWYWPLPEAGLRKRVHRIKSPALVLHGDADGLTSQRYAETLASMVPGASFATVAGASHMLAEQAEEAARLTVAHLQQS